MADPPSSPGNPTPDPAAPGYWPEKLTVTGGNLVITTTNGLAYQGSNSQDNALGIGLDLSGPATLQTELIDLPAAPGGFAQAGLWFGVSDIGEVREEFQIIYKITSGLETSCNSKNDHATESALKIFTGHREGGIILQPRISHPIGLGMCFQKLCHAHRIVAVSLHSKRQCFQPLQEHPGIIRRNTSPQIA